MRRFRAILAIVSTILCGTLLVLLPVSMHLSLPDFARDSTGNDIDPHASIAISKDFHCGLFRGQLWFFNRELAYTGSIICFRDDDIVIWGGIPSKERTDRYVRLWEYGYLAQTFISLDGGIVGCQRKGGIPGVYYRYFEWANEATPWWTLGISLWYPIALLLVLPSFSVVRFLMRRKMAKSGVNPASIAETVEISPSEASPAIEELLLLEDEGQEHNGPR